MTDAVHVERAPWTRTERLWLAAFVAGTLASLAWLAHPWFEWSNDASLYVVTARSIARGEGYSYLGQPFTVRPPGFSALLAPVVALFGTDFRAMNVFVGLFGVAGLVALFAWARPRLGAPLAFVVCAWAWLEPGYRHLCNVVLSDVPGTALLVASLLVERWWRARPSVARGLAFGVLLGASGLVRTMNALLAPAIAVASLASVWSEGARGKELVVRLFRRLAPLAIGVAIVAAPWSLWADAHRPALPVDQNYLYSYSTAMWHVDGADPSSPLRPIAELWERVPARTVQLLSLLGTRMQSPSAGAFELVLGALILLGTIAIAVRRRESGELFALGAAGMLLVFVAFLDRHALPVWLIASVAATEALVLVLVRVRVRLTHARAAAAGLLVAFTVADWGPRRDWERIESNHRTMERFCASAAEHLPARARVGSYIGWHDAVFLDRPVWSLMFGQRRDGLAGADRVVEKYALDTLVLSDFLAADRALAEHYASRAVETVPVEHGVVLRLR